MEQGNTYIEFSYLTVEEIRSSMRELAEEGKLNEFRGKFITPDSYEDWCVKTMVVLKAKERIKRYSPPSVLFKIGGVPEPIEEEEEEVQPPIDWTQHQRYKDVMKVIRRCVHEEIQKPSEIVQPSDGRYLCDIEVHVMDTASHDIINAAFRDYDTSRRTPWRKHAFEKMFDHKSNKEVSEARRLY